MPAAAARPPPGNCVAICASEPLTRPRGALHCDTVAFRHQALSELRSPVLALYQRGRCRKVRRSGSTPRQPAGLRLGPRLKRRSRNRVAVNKRVLREGSRLRDLSAKGFNRRRQSGIKRDRGCPTQSGQFRSIHELSRCSVWFGAVVGNVSVKTNSAHHRPR